MIPKEGETAVLVKTITQSDIEQFAEMVGDRNPVHVNPDFAKKTRFGRPTAHGMWGLSLISAVLGTKLPGPGTIYLSQTVKFKAPVFPGDTLTAKVKVLEVREDKPIVKLETTCENQKGELILTGESVVLVDDVK
ncbi:MAG: MaoC family dehydratase [Desulfomonilaceae bacterium]